MNKESTNNLNFYDKNTDLEWKKYNILQPNQEQQKEYITTLNSWSKCPAIRKYISDGDYGIGEMFEHFTTQDCNLYFCLINNILVGAILIYGNDIDAPATIEYIVVNPQIQGKGLGTRMISSIKSNPQFFTENSFENGWLASIHKENIASQKAFLKNKFIALKKSDYQSNYIRFYCNERQHIK